MDYIKAIFTHARSLVWFIVTVVLLALFIVVTVLSETVLFEVFRMALGDRKIESFGGGQFYVSDYEDKDDAFEKSNLVNERINEEGITLLKNESKALPLAEGAKVSVFGKNSVNLAYGGSGSGAFTVTEDTPTLYQSPEAAGFDYNPVMHDFYNGSASGDGRAESPSMDNSRDTIPGFATGETPVSSYTSAVKDSYKDYNDAALVVFTRIGGESFDLPRTMQNADGSAIDGALDGKDHYLELDKNEQDMLVEACNNFDKVIVIINSSTSMELGFLDAADDHDDTLVDGMSGIADKIDACVWIGGPGYSGINALGRVLNGTVNPSGKTVDTYRRDFTKDPTYENFSDYLVSRGNVYTVTDGKQPSVAEHYVDYEEGIYVGYRYYETRGFTDGEAWYDDNVVFPFGYGLSYTTFDWEVTEMSFDAGETLSWTADEDMEFTVTVNVTNTGDVAGKDVVQVYMTAPYTPDGIEKAYVTLVGFAKTDMLYPESEASADKPNSQEVTVTFKGYDFASYDYRNANGNEFSGYELDAGEYEVKVMHNSHDMEASRKFTLSKGVKYAKDPVTGYDVVNRYDDVSFEENYGMESELSRNDWEGTYPVNEVLAGSNAERSIPTEFMNKIKSTDTNNPMINDTTVQMPAVADVSAAPGTVQIYDLVQFTEEAEAEAEELGDEFAPEIDDYLRDEAGTIVVDYNDDRWEEYLSLLTAEEMMSFTMNGAFQTQALEGLGLMATLASDGPVGFVYFMAQIESENPVYGVCSYASECVIAATWNVELAYEMGLSVGNEGIIGNVRGGGRPYSGWYAPAINIHRSPFGGRNFEYYSEDPLMSGKLAAEVVKGARSRGVYCQLKHFAVNEQETNRSGVCTWLTEQSLREIYLRPFEIAVKEGGAMGVMSSFNRIGSLWTGGDYRLLTEILRNEWGFKGLVITDFNTEPFMDTKQMAYAGGDLNLATTPHPWTPSTAADYTVLRTNVKNILYTITRSNAMNGHGEGAYYVTYYAWWEVMLFVVWPCLVGALAIWGFFMIWSVVKQVKREKYKTESLKQ